MLKANEPRGRAESESRRRACRDAGLVASKDIVSIYAGPEHLHVVIPSEVGVTTLSLNPHTVKSAA